MISSKTWFVGIVAAILVAFGAFALDSASPKTANAGPQSLACDDTIVTSGSVVDCVVRFEDDDGGTGAGWSIDDGADDLNLEWVSCVVDADDEDTAGGGVADFANNATDNCDVTGLVGLDGVADDLDDDTLVQDFLISFTIAPECTETEDAGTITATQTIDGDETDDTLTLDIICVPAVPASVDCVASPTTLETHPASGSTDVSIIICTVEDADGNPINGISVLGLAETGVIDDPEDDNDTASGNNEASCLGVPFGEDFDTDPDTTPLQEEDNTDDNDDVDDTDDDEEDGTADFIFCATPGSDLGVTTLTFIVHNDTDDDIDDLFAEIDITIVGPADSWTLTVNKTKVVCGEKVEWSLTEVEDAIGQTVSDNTLIVIWSNFGAVVVVNDSSDNVFGGGGGDDVEAGTEDGEVNGFLLTDPGDVGIYEILVGIDTDGDNDDVEEFVQKQVECAAPAAPAPTTAAPAAGLGGPSTGDGGLLQASSTGNSALLYSIAGALAFALAGVATLRFARR